MARVNSRRGHGIFTAAISVAALAATVGTGPAGATEETSRIALLVTHDNGPETRLVLARPGLPLPPPVARLRHLPDAAVRGTLVPGGEKAAVVADDAPGRDRSWGSRLFLVSPGREAVALCDRVAYAARPLVAEDGAILVPRGEAGEARDDRMRVDALTVDEVDPRTGAVRTLLVAEGYAALPVALHRREVIVYTVGPDGARILAVDRRSGRARVVVASLPPFARDFSMSPDGRLVFACRDETRVDLWTVESVELASGARRRLHASRLAALAPHAWAGGDVTWNEASGQGLAGTHRSLATAGERLLLEVGATSPRGELAAAYLVRPARPTSVALVDGAGRIRSEIVPPPGARLEIVGLLP